MQADESSKEVVAKSETIEGNFDEYWFPQEKLGALEYLMEKALRETNKRKRASYYNNISQVLKGLGLISKRLTISRIGFGLNKLGERGLMVSTFMPTRMVTQFPEEPDTEAI